MGSGGHNRSHRTIDDFRRVDSFGLRRLMDNSVGLRWEVFDRAAIYCDFVAGTVEISQDGEYQPLKLEKAGGSDGTPTRLYFRCPRCDQRVRYLYNYHGYSRFMYLKGFTPEQIYTSFRQTQRKKHKKKREQSIMEKEVFNFIESMAEAAINEAVDQLLKDWK